MSLRTLIVYGFPKQAPALPTKLPFVPVVHFLYGSKNP